MTHLVLADSLVLRPRYWEGGQRLDLLLQLVAQLTRLGNHVIQQRCILSACAIVRRVERTRVEVGNTRDVAAEGRNAILNGGDLLHGHRKRLVVNTCMDCGGNGI